jgi:predicted helicase
MNSSENSENSNIKDPSELSRNYSGTSSFYTPPYAITCIINGLNFLLETEFKLPKGVLAKKLEFIEPSSLINYAKKNQTKSGYNLWRKNELLQKFHAFEIDPEIKNEALQKLNQNVNYYNGKPLEEKLSFHNYHLMNFLNEPQDSNPKNRNDVEKSINKRDRLPIVQQNSLIIFGNPPFAVSSKTKNPWISGLIEDYKQELNRKGKKRIVGLKGIQDDYVKFIRLSQWKICDQNNPGILAFVVNNYFLDGSIFRGMRASLLQTFDQLWIINLYGDPKKQPLKYTEIQEKDVNIFAIQTGICLFFAVKLNSDKKNSSVNKIFHPKHKPSIISKVFYCDCWGSLQKKKEFLSLPFEKIPFKPVPLRIDFEFIPLAKAALKVEKMYYSYPYLPDIFIKNIIGVQSLHDSLITHPDRKELENILKKLYSKYYEKSAIVDNIGQKWVKTEGVEYHDARDWKISFAYNGSYKKALDNVRLWQWRGVDRWWVAYDEHLMTKGSSSFSLMQYLISEKTNIAIGASRVSRKASGENSAFITNVIAESHFIEGGSGIGDYLFPLKINSSRKKKVNWEEPEISDQFNIDEQLINQLKILYNQTKSNEFIEQIFYYVYGILWSKSYRITYQIFLKKDFPNIPFFKDYQSFKNMADLGRTLADYHTLTSPEINIENWKVKPNNDISFNIRDYHFDPQMNRIFFAKNKERAFWIGDISPMMWNFEIGGYQQLNLWLKHRKNVSGNQKIKRFMFKREISKSELATFLKICHSIQLTLELLPKLERVYQNQKFATIHSFG